MARINIIMLKNVNIMAKIAEIIKSISSIDIWETTMFSSFNIVMIWLKMPVLFENKLVLLFVKIKDSINFV